MNAIDKQKADARALRAVIVERHDTAAASAKLGGNTIRHADGTLTLDPDHPVTKPYERDLKREAAERAEFDAEIAAAHAEAASRATPAPKAPPPVTGSVAVTETDLSPAKAKR